MSLPNQEAKQNWPLATWLLLSVFLIASSLFSYYLARYTDSLLLYLPTSLMIIMVHWFGPRVLLLAFINGICTIKIWNIPGDISWLLILTTKEPLAIFTSWYLCRDLINKSGGITSTSVFSRFVLRGIILPNMVNSIYIYNYSFIQGDLAQLSLLWLADFITIFIFTIPLLHFCKPIREGMFFKLVRNKTNTDNKPNNKAIIEILLITIVCLIIGFLISFDRYWFVYGIGASYIAIRYGFSYVLFINAIIFLLNYVFPYVDFGAYQYGIDRSSQLLNVHLGMSTMFFGTTLIGRVISDLRNSELAIQQQKQALEKSNDQLRKTNSEMDRFVYSVSHDISAPLKSIRGLIAVSRLEAADKEFPYVNEIEKSIRKLEDFTNEILDHSKASRKEIKFDETDLQLLLNEIIENLKFFDKQNNIDFHISLNPQKIVSDKFLLKVGIGNLISNAIKFKRQQPGVASKIVIQSSIIENKVLLTVEDNGEGIQQEYQAKIFQMFYRASETTKGSGLGLFIAKEAIEKLGGKISFVSQYKEGSTFTIELPIVSLK